MVQVYRAKLGPELRRNKSTQCQKGQVQVSATAIYIVG